MHREVLSLRSVQNVNRSMWFKRLTVVLLVPEKQCGHKDYALVLLRFVMIQTLTRLTFC